MTCHCIIFLQMFVWFELDTLFHYVRFFGLTVLLCITSTCPLFDTMLHTCMIVYATVLNFLIFLVTVLYLHAWATSLWSCTCVIAYVSFILHTCWVIFWQPWTCMSRSRSLEQNGHFSGGSDFLWGASEPVIDLSRSTLLSGSRETFFLQLVSIFSYFSSL